jgi:peptide/nickel transport system substrate-binding protein
MHRLRLALIAVVVTSAAVGVAGSSANVLGASAATPKYGGKVVFGAEQEPPCLNGLLEGCNNSWTAWTVQTQNRALFVQKPDFSFALDLAQNAKVTKTKPMTIAVTIKKQAVWNDGVPVTWKDFQYTWQQEVNPKNDIASRSGWDQIKTVKPTSKDGKSFLVIFKKPYAPWKVVFAGTPGLLPSHALAGQPDFNNVWLNDNNNPKTGKPISDGPFVMTQYIKGQSMKFVRNPKWWGPHKPYLNEVDFVFRTNTDTEIQAIRGGEVDAIYPQPQLQLADLKGQPGLKIESNAGTSLEHIDFNEQLKGGQPLLRAPWFRQALAYAINRQAVVDQIYKKFNPKQQVLQNLTYGNSQKGLYAPHFQKYVYSPAKVASIMTAHGCKKGGDGIWVCNGVKASVKYGTTTGNKLRELVQEIIQAQAKNAGIQFVTDNDPSRLFFPRVSDGNYQLAMFAWVTAGDPQGQVDIYGIGGGSNWKGYDSVKVTNLFRASDAELNPAKRAALVNAADANMALNLPTLPVVQKPTFLIYKSKIHGMRDNPTSQGPTDNMQDWRVG